MWSYRVIPGLMPRGYSWPGRIGYPLSGNSLYALKSLNVVKADKAQVIINVCLDISCS